MKRPQTHLSLAVLAALATACSGSGGSGDASGPPSLEVPSSLQGGPTSYQYWLETTETATLTFTATDPDGDALTWQVDVAAADATSAGIVYTLPEPGASFSMDLIAVGASAPAVASVTVRVQDAAGETAAIDIDLRRTVPLSLTGASPSSAFLAAPQEITLTGGPFTVQGNVGPAAHQVVFNDGNGGGGLATGVTVIDDNTLTCLSPADTVAGSHAVLVFSQYSTTALPEPNVEMYDYPVQLLAADEELSGATLFDVASDGPNLHVVCANGSSLVYKRSTDAGGTWASQDVVTNISNGIQDVKIAVDGLTVAIGYQRGVGYLDVICSADGGVTFPSIPKNITEDGVDDLQICASGSYVYLAWRDMSLQQQGILATVSDDCGVNWNNPNQYGGLVVAQPEGMNSFIVGCDGSNAWVVYAQAGAITDGLLSLPGLWTTYTTDGGDSWAASTLAVPGDAYDVASCHDEGRVYVAFGSSGQLYAIDSANAGQVWSQAPIKISPPGSVAADAVLRCAGDRLVAAYTLGEVSVGVTRVQSWSSGTIDFVDIDDGDGQIASVVGDPDLTMVGNYVFVAYSMAPLAPLQGAVPERIKFASSVDMGQSFLPAEDFGDHIPGYNIGQLGPRISVDGARVWMGWLDDRAGQGQLKLYQNRTDQ